MNNALDFAVVIGVSHYNELSRLNGPSNDATAFQNWLVSPDGGNLPPDNCKLILSQENSVRPLQDDIDDKFEEIVNKLLEERNSARRLYFYFSGHGLGISHDDTALILPKWSNFWRNYALLSRAYLETLIHSGLFQEIFFFLDCCRNRRPGIQGANPRFGNARPSNHSASCNFFVFYSTEFTTLSYEEAIDVTLDDSKTKNQIHGLYTKALLTGLNGNAAKNGSITVQSLQQFIDSYLPELLGERNLMQKARLHSSGDSSTPIVSLPVNTFPITIVFKTPGRKAILEDGYMNELKSGNTSETPWNLSLRPGNYTILFDDAPEFKTIRITSSQNINHYEF